MKKNWQIRNLGDVCNIFNGSTPLKSKKEYWEDGDVNWFTIKDIRLQGRKIKYTEQKITKNALKESSIKLLPAKAVLICCTASVGEWAISDVELTTNQQFNGMVVKDKSMLLPEYLFYFTSTLKDKLLFVSGKTTIDFVSMTKLKNIKIPFPPLPEQIRTTKILDKTFEKLEIAKKNAEKNLRNSKELFESYLQSIFGNSKDNWEEKSLGEVCERNLNIKWPNYKNHEFEYIDLSAVSRKDLKITSSVSVNFKNAPSRAKKIIKKDDIIFATTRPTLKRIARVSDKYDNQICSTGFVVLRAKQNNVLPEIIFYFLQTFVFIDSMEKFQRGASYPAVSDSDVKGQIISFPKNIMEQQAIVKKLDNLSKQTKKLEKIYQQKISNLIELKKSILKKAFEGGL